MPAFVPDIVHGHDWQAGLVPAYLLLVLQILFSGSFEFIRHNLFLIPAVTLATLLQVFVSAFTMLALSSLSKSSRYVGILYAAVIFFTQAIYGVLYAVTRSTALSWISFSANLAQIGDAYVWGATGPSAFDCSGLTMTAWAQAGVSLPHSSYAQFNMGRRVSLSRLKPGDLLFFYGLGHVGMYIGHGKYIDAPQTGERVHIKSLAHGLHAIDGARRILAG